jgi:hypothetical protein
MVFELLYVEQIDDVDHILQQEKVDPEKNGGIEDPWHSRPLDVHLVSDHPDIDRITDEVWTKYFEVRPLRGRKGKHPKRNAKQPLKTLLLDLYVAWMEDPTLCIGVSMSKNSWDSRSRYNALRITRKITEVVHGLNGVGLVLLAKGSYGGPWGLGNRTTRIRASPLLVTTFQETTVSRADIGQVEGRECIILKGGDDEGGKPLEYKDTDETVAMRQEVLEYNTLLSNTYIDIPELEDPWLLREDKRGRQIKVPIDQHHQFIRRTFNRGDWGCGGRFYGPWWQQLGSDLRAKIFINDTPTVEVDFKGMHVAIIAVQEGVAVPEDAYVLPPYLIKGVTTEQQRKLIKKLVLIALNAKDRKTAFSSFRDDWPAGDPAKKLTNAELEKLLDSYIEHYPFMTNHLGADRGIRLMNIDSQIMAIVQQEFTKRGIPVLTIHDSAIVDYTRVGLLKRFMVEAAKKVVGSPLPLTAKHMGMDEYKTDLEHQLDFQAWRETERSEGYLNRLGAWERRKGLDVLPYKHHR